MVRVACLTLAVLTLVGVQIYVELVGARFSVFTDAIAQTTSDMGVRHDRMIEGNELWSCATIDSRKVGSQMHLGWNCIVQSQRRSRGVLKNCIVQSLIAG